MDIFGSAPRLHCEGIYENYVRHQQLFQRTVHKQRRQIEAKEGSAASLPVAAPRRHEKSISHQSAAKKAAAAATALGLLSSATSARQRKAARALEPMAGTQSS